MRIVVEGKKIAHVMALIGLMILWGLLAAGREVQAEGGTGADQSALAASGLGLKYQWHTFYGIADADSQFNGVAVDPSGNVYLAGVVHKTWGAPLHAYSGNADVVVIKLNSLGVYQWHTFYGASPISGEDGDDEAAGIAVDANGNVYVTGYSDRTWRGPGNANPLHAHGVSEEMFVLKLNSNGAYQWHTFYQPGRANAIALDSAANVYVTGYSTEAWGSPKHSADSTGLVVVLKLNSNGVYQWHTYYGAGAGAGDEAGYGLATDALANVYLSGVTTYSWLGDGNAAPLHAFSGGDGYSTDIVVLKLNGSGVYQWHTFYGASGTDDKGADIAWGGNGLSVAGTSADTWGNPLHAYTSERDIAILRLNAAGQYQWHTFYGSTGEDSGTGVSIDADGNSYVAGYSAATWQGNGNAGPVHPYSGYSDLVALKLTAGGQYVRHTFYGSVNDDDGGVSIALDDQYGVFVAGNSAATWSGDGGTGPINPHSGNANGDGFALKLSDRIYRVYLPVVIKSRS